MTTVTDYDILTKGREALDELADQGVGLLYVEHIQGHTGEPLYCPVAEYLNRRTGHKWGVYLANAVLVGGTKFVELPVEVTALVHQIDHGMYPELIRRAQLDR